MKEAPSHPTGWITFWIGIGVAALAVFVVIPILVMRRSQAELIRFDACQRGVQRTNCEPSLVWLLNGWMASSTATTSN